MNLVKFTTNSIQEFINEPFKGSENTKNQQKIINQSTLVEKITFDILKQFIPQMEQNVEAFINEKKNGQYEEVIEFTSGKVLFVTDLDSDKIDGKFKQIHDQQVERANEEGTENIISFNYVISSIQPEWKQLTYNDLASNIDKQNIGYNQFINMFDQLVENRFGLEYRKSNGTTNKSLKSNAINLSEILEVEDELITERQSYTTQADKTLYNKLMIYKLDLNNIGAYFNELKTKSVSEYSKASIRFFELVRTQYIQNLFDEQNLFSKCAFAAGDDILLLVRIDELLEVQNILNELLSDINSSRENEIDQITYAGGLQVVDYRIPIRLYYPKVEEELSKAKKDKTKSCISFNSEVYSNIELEDMIQAAMCLVNLEERFTNSSAVYYNILDRLDSLEIDPLLTIMNILLNSNSNHENVLSFFMQLTEEYQSSRAIQNIIQIALMYAYTCESEIEYDGEFDAQSISTKLVDTYIIHEYLQLFGKSSAFYQELLHHNNLEANDFNEKLEDTIFRKNNSLYYSLSSISKEVSTLVKTDKKARANQLMALMLVSKINSILIKEEIENEKN